VTNNYLTHKQWNDFSKAFNDCKGSSNVQACQQQVVRTYQNISAQQDAALNLACVTNTPQCTTLLIAAIDGSKTAETLVQNGKLPDNYLGGANFNNNVPLFVQTYVNNQVNEYCRTNPKECNDIKPALIALGVAGGASGAFAIAANFSRIAAWAGATVQACLGNVPLCINQASITAGDVLVGDALGGASIVGSAALIGRTTRGADGVIKAIPDQIPYHPPGSIVPQGSGPYCGPACAAMTITDGTGKSVDLKSAIGMFENGIRPTGVDSNEISKVLSNAGVKNTVELNLVPDQLNAALAQGETVILNIPVGREGRHFIIVDSIRYENGMAYYMTRDPFVGPRGVITTRLAAVISGAGANAIIIRK
jgi:hypothetical protein